MYLNDIFIQTIGFHSLKDNDSEDSVNYSVTNKLLLVDRQIN